MHARHGHAHQACRLLVAGQGEKGQEAVAGALLKLLGSCPYAVLGLPQLMAAGMEDSAAGLLSLLRAKAGRLAIHEAQNHTTKPLCQTAQCWAVPLALFAARHCWTKHVRCSHSRPS